MGPTQNTDTSGFPAPEDLAAETDETEPIIEFGDAPPDGALKRGVEVIRAHWKHAPPGPGVYRMLGADGEVLYVGKARSVRKRIASYMRLAGQTHRIARMISLTASMVFVSTGTETEALLLETNYIKQMKPRFNVLMRDDKSFPYIFISGDHPAPQIMKHRGARDRKGDYFGPFASVWAVNRTLNALERAFLLRSCTDSYFANRTRPCLLHQIKRCSAPCTGEIGLEDYAELVDEARAFLSGKSRAVRDMLAKEMNEAAEALAYEHAARLRDRIAALSNIQGAQGINPHSVEEADVFAIAEDAGQFCIEVFFFRTYQNWGNRAYFPRADKSLSPNEVLDAFLDNSMPISRPRGLFCSRTRSRIANCSNARFANAPAIASKLRCRSGARRKTSSITPRKTRARRLAENWRTARARRSCSPHSPPPSASKTICGGSRSTTIPTSWARMPSAR